MQLTWQQSIGVDTSHLASIDNGLGGEVQVNQAIADDLALLKNALETAGMPIAIVSAFRSFDHQLKIWNDKWQGYRPVYSRHGRPLNIVNMSDIEKYKAIALWSAMPGFSRHHWGTDLDIFLADPINSGYQVELTPEEFAASGPCASLNLWLDENLSSYGFFRPYAQYQGGVSEEPWHISHQSVSKKFIDSFSLAECKKHISQSEIKSANFICEKLNHYQDNYFLNICEAK